MTTFAKEIPLVGVFYNIQLVDLTFDSLSADYQFANAFMKQENEEPKQITVPVKELTNTKVEAIDLIIERLQAFRKQCIDLESAKQLPIEEKA